MNDETKRKSRTTELLRALEEVLFLAERMRVLAEQTENALFCTPKQPLPEHKEQAAGGIIGDTTAGLLLATKHLHVAESALNRIERELAIGS